MQGIQGDTTKQLLDRYTDINKELADYNTKLAEAEEKEYDIAEIQKEISRLERKKETEENLELIEELNEQLVEAEENEAEIAKFQERINALTKEQQQIQGEVDEDTIKRRLEYDNLTKAQKILLAEEKKIAEATRETAEAQQILIEKKKVLQAIDSGQEIQTSEQNGVLSASFTREDGKVVEITEKENIELAHKLQNRKDMYKEQFKEQSNNLSNILSKTQETLNTSQELR